MTPLVLYATSGCHLCELAEAMLGDMLAAPGWQVVEIAEDDGLLERYGIRIPVVLRVHDGAELGWPFDREMLRRFIAGA